ncbi:MAG TPA: alpha/beta hydrolase [Chloroflexota bacterium]|jgi:pimeloyl-ACP methyl ester carboxylesterase
MAKSIWVELLGAEVRLIQGPRFRSRILEAGREHPETLILTHPGGGHVESFARNIVPLGQHIHTVAMEMLWHGFSDTPPIGEDRVAREAEQVVDLLDALGVERAWVHGNASGGVVPTWLALNRPDRLKGIIYEATTGNVQVQTGAPPPPPPTSAGGLTIAEQTLQLLQNPTREGVRERLLHAFHPRHPERIPDELVDVRLALYSRPATNEAMTRYYSHRIRYAVSEEEIARIDLPVLVLGSDARGEQSFAGQRRLAAIIPGAQFKLLENTGLWGHWEAAAEFNEAVRQFILGAGEGEHGA